MAEQGIGNDDDGLCARREVRRVEAPEVSRSLVFLPLLDLLAVPAILTTMREKRENRQRRLERVAREKREKNIAQLKKRLARKKEEKGHPEVTRVCHSAHINLRLGLIYQSYS